MNVIFRADGNNQIGLGHVTRSLAVAQMLKLHFQILFVCKEITPNLKEEILSTGFSYKQIDEETELFQFAKTGDIVVLDHYGLSSDFQRQVKDNGCWLVCIDDIYDKCYYADLIINHAPNVLASCYQAQSYTQFALGLDYVMLRPVFFNTVDSQKLRESIEIVFVCFGGSDSKNLTQDTVEILKLDDRFSCINIVVGAAYAALGELKQSVKDDKRVNLFVDLDSTQIAELIKQSDLCIVPSSGILQEVLALRAKAISGIYTDNQTHIFREFKKLGAFESAENFTAPAIKHAIDQSFKNENQTPTKFIDGKSGERILKMFLSFLLNERVFLKKISSDDLLQTYEWATNQDIRKFFFNPSKVSFEEHSSWFNARLKNKNSYYFLAYLDNDAFGSIRFDVTGHIATVSYLIDPKFHGRGLGTIILSRGVQALLNETTNEIKAVQGEVLIANKASIRVFEKLGYKAGLNKEGDLYEFKKNIEWVG